jgi:hypothetical protein
LSRAETMRSAMSPSQSSFIKHQESGLSTKFLTQSRNAVSESDVSTSQLRRLSTTKLSHGASQGSSFGTTQMIPMRSLSPSSENVRQSSSTDSHRLNSRKSEKTDVPTISTSIQQRSSMIASTSKEMPTVVYNSYSEVRSSESLSSVLTTVSLSPGQPSMLAAGRTRMSSIS